MIKNLLKILILIVSSAVAVSFAATPTGITLTNNTINENADVGTTIGMLSTVDTDISDTHTYTLKVNDDDRDFVLAELDRIESLGFTSGNFGAVQDSSAAKIRQFRFDELTENETISIANLLSDAYTRNMGDNFDRDTLIAKDSNNKNYYFYPEISASFEIYATNTLVSKIKFDFEIQSTYTATVNTNDGLNNFQEDIAITIIDVDDPVTFTSAADISLNENISTVTTVVAVSDTNRTITYTIDTATGGADRSLFLIDLTSAVLSFKIPPDFENPTDVGGDNTYNLIVTAADDASPANEAKQTITITILDIVNEVPTDITLSGVTIFENADVGTIIGMLSTTDQNIDDTHTYTVKPNNDDAEIIRTELRRIQDLGTFNNNNNIHPYLISAAAKFRVFNFSLSDDETNALRYALNPNTSSYVMDIDELILYQTIFSVARFYPEISASFEISATNTLVSKVKFDYETKSTYTATVNTNDGLNDFQKDITIDIINVDDPVTFTSAADIILNENISTVITVVAVSDTNRTITYTIDATNDVDLFSIGPTSGVLSFKIPPDYENPTDTGGDNTYNLIVTATDDASPANKAKQTITIVISDIVNEVPTDITLSGVTIFENADVGTIIGMLSSTDQDNDTHTYTVKPNNYDADIIRAELERIQDLGTFNNNNNIYPYLISAAANFRVFDFSLSDDETNALRYVLNPNGGFYAIDPDDLNLYQFNFAITHFYPEISASFEISATNTLVSKVKFDYEAKSTYTATINTNDGLNDFQQDFIIGIINVFEPLTITSTDTFSVLENTTAVATLSATDGNGIVTFSTNISGANAASFTLTADGVLAFNTAPVFSTTDAAANIYNITISATNGDATATQTVTINVFTQSTFNLGTNTITLTENAANTIRHQVNITAIDKNSSAANATLTISTAGGIFTTEPAPVVSFSDSSIVSTTTLSSTAQTATLYFTIIPDTTGAGTITITLTDENNNVIIKTLTIIVGESDNSPIITNAFDSRFNSVPAIFGGHLYGSIDTGTADDLSGIFATNTAYAGSLARMDSKQEHDFVKTIRSGQFWIDGNNNANEDIWVYANGEAFNFDTSDNEANGNALVFPGFYNLWGNADQPYYDGCISSNGNTAACDSNAADGGVFEFPNGFVPLTQASFALNQAATLTQVATLSGFDLDGDSITWSYTDSAEGSATFTNNTVNTGVSSTTVAYQPDSDFAGTTTLNIILTDSNNNSATMAINIDVAGLPKLANQQTQTYVVNTQISPLSFVNTGGVNLTNCSSAPDLPVGLSVELSANNSTCEISGTPSATASAKIYAITATNISGTDSATLSITVNPAAITFSLDVDGNGSLTASNDGLIIFKYLLNSNANNLHTTIANNALEGRQTTVELKAYLDDAGDILDVDGNQTLTASNDGLIIFKYLLNSNANNLHTTIANNALEGRQTTAELKAYLDTYQ